MNLAMAAIGDLLASGQHRLDRVGIENARREARLLLAAALDRSWGDLVGREEQPVAPETAARFEDFVRRRSRHEPVSRILGRREFWSLDFGLSAATLDPRADSETLIEAVLETVADRDAPLSILDLGCGTGCLLLALLSELPNAKGIGVDLAPLAVATASANAARLGLERRARFRIADWDSGLAGRFDIVVSNPPYIPAAEIATLAPEVVLHDPHLALDGGPDGLAAHRRLARIIPRRLAAGGIAVVEHGDEQGPAAQAIYEAGGLTLRKWRADLGGHWRCLVMARKAAKKTVGKAGATV
ncbi:release factor glutamine methyltransferase [Hypericibacter adhaerens]|jgi:release factor glutamine methyltransferase|uniref:Release factor glutamine methyltransferase n=1 Tax=Hypericibacter adhaerens TaxID=2602016 RepID=A0A5J6N3C4_9PROT|nr:peptide chain release factor N(5)-glutamine methyltransferase [Hypericibacter adhaerens]QEX24279.1 release factor glutamine methyltransferase [Hypericibacter adhaerens]